MSWIKKNKDLLITLGVFGFFVLLALLTSTFFKTDKKYQGQGVLQIEDQVSIDLSTQGQNPLAESNATTNQKQPTTFFLRPSPEELLDKLEAMSYQEFRKETRDLPGLRVMWPAYFFSVVKLEDKKAEVMLDAAEDGFGVVLIAQIDTTQYPEILQKKRGERVWLAAEITGVDPTGTGQFFLNAEHIRFDDYQPQQVIPQSSVQ